MATGEETASVKHVADAIQALVNVLHREGHSIFVIAGALIGGGVELFVRNGLPKQAVHNVCEQVIAELKVSQ
jgi:hypothetical protein